MNKRKVAINFLCLLVCLLVLTGCDRSAKERDKALAEAEKAKAKLVKIEAAFKKLQDVKDELDESFGIIYEKWEKASTELEAVTQAHNGLLVQIDELTNERDTAINQAKEFEEKVDRITPQLQEKSKENQEFQEWVKELQATIEDLESQFEESVEQLEEEVTDGNNV